MHTARDGEIKRVETEIFSPGKGNLRSTQPGAHEDDDSPPKKSKERFWAEFELTADTLISLPSLKNL